MSDVRQVFEDLHEAYHDLSPALSSVMREKECQIFFRSAVERSLCIIDEKLDIILHGR